LKKVDVKCDIFIPQFGSLNGLVYLFHVTSNVPPEVQKVLKDYGIATLQSAVLDDKVKLHQVNGI
jgi:hypothetical protein